MIGHFKLALHAISRGSTTSVHDHDEFWPLNETKITDIHDHDESLGWQFEHSEVINDGHRLKSLETLPWVKIAVIVHRMWGSLG